MNKQQFLDKINALDSTAEDYSDNIIEVIDGMATSYAKGYLTASNSLISEGYKEVDYIWDVASWDIWDETT